MTHNHDACVAMNNALYIRYAQVLSVVLICKEVQNRLRISFDVSPVFGRILARFTEQSSRLG